jgi:hypothetical protein
MNKDQVQLEAMLDSLGDPAGSHGPGAIDARSGSSLRVPEAFLRGVRRQRTIRRARMAGGAVLGIACAVALMLTLWGTSPRTSPVDRQIVGGTPDPVVPPEERTANPETRTSDTAPQFAFDWPALPSAGTGGPALPVRVGMRPSSPMARAILR